jgi:hypothetical protein
VELEPGYEKFDIYPDMSQVFGQKKFQSLNITSLEAAALDLLTLEEYHEICYFQFPQLRTAWIYNPRTINLGAVISCSSGNQLGDFVEIAFLPGIKSDLGIPRWNTAPWIAEDVMEDGWTRYYSSPLRD